MSLKPVRVVPSFREKIWGATRLEPWFPDSRAKIGEVWLTCDENAVEGGGTVADLMRERGAALLGPEREWERFPLLTKFIFTSERLSVQVHPDDELARQWEHSAGKTEMWHILRSEDGAVALGFSEALTRERLRQAALTGEIENFLRWVPVQPGDCVFVPAGTVHAIGGGLALCEIQQNSDVTYRLFDYGRPRELHLEKGVAVAELAPHPGIWRPVELAPGQSMLACCQYFAAELLQPADGLLYEPEPARLHVLIVIEGAGAFGGVPFRAGDAWIIPATAEPFRISLDSPVRLLKTYVPPQCR